MLSFSKYHGLGNDFILIDDRQEHFPADDALLISRLCARRTGIGADGLILLQDALNADYRMRVFNADGREAEMCGNGLRCLLLFLRDLGLSKEELRILVGGGLYHACFEGANVALRMGRPKEVSWNIRVSLAERELEVHYVHLGVP